MISIRRAFSLATLGVLLSFEPIQAINLDLSGFEEPLKTVLQQAVSDTEEADFTSAQEQAFAWGRLGMLLQAHNLYEPALGAYSEAIQLAQDAQWLYLRAICSMELGFNEDSVSDLEQVVQLQSQVPTIWLRLGNALMRLGQLAEAEIALHKAKELHSESAPVLVVMAELHSLRHEWHEARTALLKAHDLEPNAGQIAYRLSQVEKQLGQFEASERWLAMRSNQLAPAVEDPMLLLVASHSVNPTFYVSAARRAWERGEYETATEAYRQAIQLDPSNIENNLGFIKLLLNLKQWREAEAVLEDSESLMSQVSEYWYLKALLYAETDRFDQATQAAKQSIAIEPTTSNQQLLKDLHAIR